MSTNLSQVIQHPRVAIIGLGFGAEFIPIYQRHPNAELVAICQRNPKTLNTVGDKFGIDERFTDFDALLADPDIDAVHINTPIPDHAKHTLKALRAGKHVACTVPMATSEEDCKAIVDACRESGLKYMMDLSPFFGLFFECFGSAFRLLIWQPFQQLKG